MHEIEPFYRWREYYESEADQASPMHGREYSEFAYDQKIYNYYIHPQWDNFGSETLFLKVLMADYKRSYAIIELIGEWNDCLHNDIMFLKRDVVDEFIHHGINQFILIGENVLNFHASDDSYYEEWFEDVDDGWIAFINFREHVIQDFQEANIDYYMISGGRLNDLNWRTNTPQTLFDKVESMVTLRLGA